MAPALAGHAGDTPAPGEVVHGDCVKANALPARRQPVLPEDRSSWLGKEDGGVTEI